MNRWNVIICPLDGQNDVGIRWQKSLTQHWPTDIHPIVTNIMGLEDLNSAEYELIDLVLFIVGQSYDSSLALHALAMLEEACVPVTSLYTNTPDENDVFLFAGALLDPVDTQPELLCAKLQGLLHRQSMIRQLRQEVSVAQRFQGGLRGEISRMHEELQLAAMVQREFLPREIPSLHGIDFGVLWRPASYISGDIYDIMRLDEDHIGLFIADAVGHGVPAALMTMVISRSLVTRERSNQSLRILEPWEVMSRLNTEMIRLQGQTTRFATGAYALINCRSRELRLAGAGHPPPLLLSADNEIKQLETQGGLLGIFEDETYNQIEIELAVGDRMLAYSDGFEQAFPLTSEDDYERRLPTMRYKEVFLESASAETPQEMVQILGQRLDDESGSLHQVDDLTFICMHTFPLVETEERRARSRSVEDHVIADNLK